MQTNLSTAISSYGTIAYFGRHFDSAKWIKANNSIGQQRRRRLYDNRSHTYQSEEVKNGTEIYELIDK